MSQFYEPPSFRQFVCLTGLPRTGSTLLSALLSQNPLIHAEGNSAVCQLMWDTQVSIANTAKEQLMANHKGQAAFNLIARIPHVYYRGITEPIVVDKCRSWSLSPNIQLLRTYVDANIKLIVLERSVLEIVGSFAKLYRRNGITGDALTQKLQALMVAGSEPIMRSIGGIGWAKKNNENGTFLFVQYRDLVSAPEATLARVYQFCGWAPYQHQFEHIYMKYPEDDQVYGLVGQHAVRPSLTPEPTDYETLLPADIREKCAMVDRLMGYVA